MGLFVSTVSANFTIDEFGLTLVHPAVDYELSAQFSSEEIKRATTLTVALQAGTLLTWKKTSGGSVEPASDYDPDFIETEDENVGPGNKDDRAVTFKDLDNVHFPQDTHEPTGFPIRFNSLFNFVDATRLFTITPTGASFDILVWGERFTYTTQQSIYIPDVAGAHYIYVDGDGVLKTERPWLLDFGLIATVAYISWDVELVKHQWFGDERHGIVMDGRTHSYLHNTVGAVSEINDGLEIINLIVRGDGSLDTHAKFGITDGNIWDEDLKHEIIHETSPTPYDNTYGQILSPYAEIPVYYLEGVGEANHHIHHNNNGTAYPVLWDGVNPIQYNKYDSGTNTWTLEYATNGNYVAMFFYATNNMHHPIIALLGSIDGANAIDAADTEAIEHTLSHFPASEMVPLYRVVFKTDTAYINEPKATIFAQGLIQEDLENKDRWAMAFSNTGLANQNKYFSFEGVSTGSVPFEVPVSEPSYLRTVTLKSSNVATISIGFYAVIAGVEAATPFATITMTAATSADFLFSEFLNGGTEFSIKVISGSALTPTMGIWFQKQF